MRMWMNSSYVKEGDYFLVDKNNEKYVSKAISNGACKIITELDKEYEIPTVKTESIRKYLYDNYYEKIKDITLIGITGTNGKTTTCYLIYQMLKNINIKALYIGTIGVYIENEVKELNNTTPSMDVLYNLLLDAKEANVKVAIMEVSSHALKQDRVHGLKFDAVGVTNITQDHLDYHKSMEDYVASKKKIINMTRNNKICILNKKDKHYKEFINKDNNNIIIGRTFKIKKVIKKIDKTKIYVKEDKEKLCFETKLVGDFNVYNFLMAFEIIKHLGYDFSKIISNAYLYEEPKGRMQKITYNKNVIFVDYAHTPDAVENVLKTVNKIKNKGVITIIGCGGNRDKSKRKKMANIACNNSKMVIFTNDNPRYEDEKAIMNDILKGASGKFEVIYDRFNAIKKGIKLLNQNMILMILGKGHECYQIIGDKKLYFSDLETVNEIINKIK